MKNSEIMMKLLFHVSVIFVCFLPHRMGIAESVETDNRMNAQRLWEYMTTEKPYQHYSYWPGKEGFYKSLMPAANIQKLYLNNLALDTVVNKKGLFPHGSLLIKEMYTDDKKLNLITVMYKEKGFDPSGNDWYWVKYKPDGNAPLEGKVEHCIECHVGTKGNDYVFTGSIK